MFQGVGSDADLRRSLNEFLRSPIASEEMKVTDGSSHGCISAPRSAAASASSGQPSGTSEHENGRR